MVNRKIWAPTLHFRRQDRAAHALRQHDVGEDDVDLFRALAVLQSFRHIADLKDAIAEILHRRRIESHTVIVLDEQDCFAVSGALQSWRSIVGAGQAITMLAFRLLRRYLQRINLTPPSSKTI